MPDTTTTTDPTVPAIVTATPPTLLDLARAVIDAHGVAVTSAAAAVEADDHAHAADEAAHVAHQALADTISALKAGADAAAA